jgi:hypothetical protein
MLTKKVGGSRLALPPPFFAETRFWGASLSDKPITFSLLTRRSIGSLERLRNRGDRLIAGHGFEVANIVL